MFQATLPEVLPDEADYTRALTLSRLAYDLESLLSPALAAMLLLVLSYHGLFVGTALGFAGSALLVVSVVLPPRRRVTEPPGIGRKLTEGLRLYLATPRLRGLLALTLAAAAGSALVIVNTVVIVREGLARAESAVALALMAYGAGSMALALLLPRLLARYRDRALMLAAAAVMTVLLTVLAMAWPHMAPTGQWWLMLTGWALLGMAYAALATPGGRLLRRSASAEQLPALFAAQFSLSHLCWLLAYPLVGWLGSALGTVAALWGMAALALTGTALAWRLWPVEEDSPS